MNRTKYYKSTDAGGREEFIERMNLKDAPIAIDADRFTEPKGLVTSKSKGPNDNDIEDNGLGVAYPPDDVNEDEEDQIGSGPDSLRNSGRGIRITRDEYRGGNGRVISRRRWD
jgi:hypothetical protein